MIRAGSLVLTAEWVGQNRFRVSQERRLGRSHPSRQGRQPAGSSQNDAGGHNDGHPPARLAVAPNLIDHLPRVHGYIPLHRAFTDLIPDSVSAGNRQCLPLFSEKREKSSQIARIPALRWTAHRPLVPTTRQPEVPAMGASALSRWHFRFALLRRGKENSRRGKAPLCLPSSTLPRR